MSKIYLGTNWKMSKSIAEGNEYIERLLQYVERYKEHFQIFIIPSHTALSSAKARINGTKLWLGAQNMHWEDYGAYTGEISPIHLKEIGVDLIELGHSERRQYFNESDEHVNLKLKAALKHGLNTLVCIGEPYNIYNTGNSVSYIKKQLEVIFKNISHNNLENIIIAYEPIWAIGEHGKEADADYVNKMHKNIKVILNNFYNQQVNIPVLFGGSVNIDNAVSYLESPYVDGLFIGRSAWDIHKFEQILEKTFEIFC